MSGRVPRWTAAAAAAALLAAGSAGAQSDSSRAQLGLKRIGSYLSYTTVDHGHSGWELGGDLDVGSVIRPALHLVGEVNYLHADFDNGANGPAISGSFHDFSVSAAARLSIVHVHRVEPYVGAGLGVHFLGTDIAKSQPIHDQFTGTKLGGEYFGGVSYDVTRDARWALYAEVRRVEVSPVSRTTYRLGFFVRM